MLKSPTAAAAVMWIVLKAMKKCWMFARGKYYELNFECCALYNTYIHMELYVAAQRERF